MSLTRTGPDCNYTFPIVLTLNGIPFGVIYMYISKKCNYNQNLVYLTRFRNGVSCVMLEVQSRGNDERHYI